MNNKTIKLLIIILLIAVLVFAAAQFFARRNSPAVNQSAGNNTSTSTTGQPTVLAYDNNQYGFSFSLPASWTGYTIVNGTWTGYAAGDSGDKKFAEGSQISIRHPLWTEKAPRQDIPIMIFTLSQWQDLQNDKFHIGAAPIGPSELGRNGKYVFALPARYNFAFPAGYEEVDQIIQSHPLKNF